MLTGFPIPQSFIQKSLSCILSHDRREAQLSLFIPANTQVFAFIVGLGENHDDHDKSNFLALYRSELFKNWS